MASAVAMAAAVAYAAAHDSPDPHEMLEEVAREVLLGERVGTELADYDAELGERVGDFTRVAEQLPRLLDKGELALDWIEMHGRLCLGVEAHETAFATQSRAILAVPTALLIAARHLDSYVDGVLEAVNRGGDTDTIAAMVGAILGALHGPDGIPEEWQAILLAREQIEARATWLATGVRPDTWRPQVEFERELTCREARLRQRVRHEDKQRKRREKDALAAEKA